MTPAALGNDSHRQADGGPAVENLVDPGLQLIRSLHPKVLTIGLGT